MTFALNNIKRRDGIAQHRFECMIRGGVTYLRPHDAYTECTMIEPGVVGKGGGGKGTKGKGKGKAEGTGKKGFGKKGGDPNEDSDDDDVVQVPDSDGDAQPNPPLSNDEFAAAHLGGIAAAVVAARA